MEFRNLYEIYMKKLHTITLGRSIYLATSLPLTKQAPQLFFFFFWNILNRKKGNENEKRMSVVRTSQLGPDSRHTAKVGNRQPSLPMCSQGSWSKVGS